MKEMSDKYMFQKSNLHKINEYLWEIPQSWRADMRVPARIYATENILTDVLRDRSLTQLVNVTTLPGIQKYAVLMPDAHEGYGFPIGGVAAFSLTDGVISPGGIGYDINCGVRLLRSEKNFAEIKTGLEALAQAMSEVIPSGVGRHGRLTLRDQELALVLEQGANRLVAMGWGEAEDLAGTESGGVLVEAQAAAVSTKAKSRGRSQLGTMGAGNHFVEIEVVETIFDDQQAARLGIFLNQVVVLIHSGSRGLGHQVATDYIQQMVRLMPTYGLSLPDRELACVPFASSQGQAYLRAMSASANFAWANRQAITHEVRQAWRKALGLTGGRLRVVYDVAHNIAKIESGLVVHRKGATRAFPGQPVIIPGSMGTGSYLLLGQEQSLTGSFGSSCHGAGRVMSRTQARRQVKGIELRARLKRQGVVVTAGSVSDLGEEAPEAYKDVDEIVAVIHNAGLAKKVARLRPVAVIKG